MHSSLSDLPIDCQKLVISFSLDALARLALSNHGTWAMRGAEVVVRNFIVWKDLCCRDEEEARTCRRRRGDPVSN